MLDYLVLNGVKSTSIKGLLIQELPPISKPLMRAEIEEIDGRDGDIITPLGYAAYDKTVLIGLYGDFKIDDVIAYFNSAGTVIFSNEPDKYYNYQIIDQIDFEKLIRFREATVTFHVQPFKYSSIEQPINIDVANGNPVWVNGYSQTKNGITVKGTDSTITITGTGGSGATEFYVPISALKLPAGNYRLNVTATGTGAGACPVRLIQSVPSNAESLGGNYITPSTGKTVSLNATLATDATFNYVWFYISGGTSLNVTITVTVSEYSLFVLNSGNTAAKPILTVYGTDTVNLSLNGTQIFTINIAEYGSITIDSVAMEAYLGSILMNRQVTGNYENLALPIGANTISWTGNVTQVVIDKYSRWI